MRDLGRAAAMKPCRPQATRIHALNSVVAELEEALRKLQLQNSELKLRHAVLENLCHVNQLALQVVASVGPVLSHELSPESQASSSAAIVAAEQQIAHMVQALGLSAAAAERGNNTWMPLLPPRLDAPNAASAVLQGQCLSLLEHSLLLVQSCPEQFAFLASCSPQQCYELGVGWAALLDTALDVPKDGLCSTAVESASAAAAPTPAEHAAVGIVVSDGGTGGDPACPPAAAREQADLKHVTHPAPLGNAAAAAATMVPAADTSGSSSHGGSSRAPVAEGADQDTAVSTYTPEAERMVQWCLHKWQQALEQDPAKGLASCVLDLMAILLCCNLIDPAIVYATVLHSFQEWGFPPQQHLQAVLDAVQLSDEQFEAIAAARRVHQDILLPLVAAGQEVQQELTQLLRVMQQEQQRRVQSDGTCQPEACAAPVSLLDNGGMSSCQGSETPTAAAAAAAAEGAGAGRGGSSGPFPDLQMAQGATAVELYEQLRVLTRRLTAAHRTLGWVEQGQDFHAFGLLTFKQIAIMASKLRPWPAIIRRVVEYAALQWEARQQQQEQLHHHHHHHQQQQQQEDQRPTPRAASSSCSTGVTTPRPCWSYTQEEVKQQQGKPGAAVSAAELPPPPKASLACGAVSAQQPKQPQHAEQQQQRLGLRRPLQERQQQEPQQSQLEQQQPNRKGHRAHKQQQQHQQQQHQQQQHQHQHQQHQQQQQQHQQQQSRQQPVRLSLAAAPGQGLRLQLQLQSSSEAAHSAPPDRGTLALLQLVQASNTLQHTPMVSACASQTAGTAADAVAWPGAAAATPNNQRAEVTEAVERMLQQLSSGRSARPPPPAAPAPVAAAAAAAVGEHDPSHQASATAAAAATGRPQQQPPSAPLTQLVPLATSAPHRLFALAPSSSGVGCAGDLLHPMQVCEGLLGGRQGGGRVVLEPGAQPDMVEVLLALQQE